MASVQTLSGTGSLRVCADLLVKIAGVKELFLPTPSWGNHAKIFGAGGLDVKGYGYLDAAGTGLDFALMKADLAALPTKSVVLLHAAAHNPTGVDPTAAQWDELAVVFKEKGLVPLFDTAYQGFATVSSHALFQGVASNAPNAVKIPPYSTSLRKIACSFWV